MKQFLLKIWTVINSPIADMIGGFIFILVGVYLLYSYSELTVACFVAAVSGGLIMVGYDCIGHGFDRRKPSGNE